MKLAQRQSRVWRDLVKLQCYLVASPRTISIVGCDSLGAALADLCLNFVFGFGEEVVELEDVDARAEVGEVEDEVSVGDWEFLRAGGRDVSMGGVEFGCRVRNTLVLRDSKPPGLG